MRRVNYYVGPLLVDEDLSWVGHLYRLTFANTSLQKVSGCGGSLPELGTSDSGAFWFAFRFLCSFALKTS